MANALLPAAGRSCVQRTQEFTFQAVREKPDPGICEGYACENIPEYIYDYKWTNYHDQNCQQQQNIPQRKREPQHYRGIPTDLNPPEGFEPGYPNFFPTNTGEVCTASAGYRMSAGQNQGVMGQSYQQIQPTATGMHHFQTGQRDQKPPTVPMQNCRPLHCCGSSRTCLMPNVSLHGATSDQSPCCGWQREPGCDRVRLPDPQVVRPHNKALHGSTRPTGHPYFVHGQKNSACPPAQAPQAIPTGFTFERWLATTHEREPPAALRDHCIGSLCGLCGPRTVECCPGPDKPYNYLLAKMG